jgi:hypothetical protein
LKTGKILIFAPTIQQNMTDKIKLFEQKQIRTHWDAENQTEKGRKRGDYKL